MIDRFYNPPKVVHLGAMVDPDGNASALCYRRPRPIDLRKASWTLADDLVSCPRCRKAIRDAQAAAESGR